VNRALLVAWGVLSFVTFLVYAWDKSAARRGARRVPESRLLWLGFLGGAPGALLGMTLFRHKTTRVVFWLVNWLGLAWVTAAMIWIFFGQT
jgi:uncharacterized membrane protein YsdA (DUF1294 family)